MKTEVKFRELPEKVQYFLQRVFFNGALMDSLMIETAWLQNMPEWKDATDEERLAYAEWRYPDGTVALFGEAKRRAEVRWPLIITGTGMIGDSNSPASAIYINTVNKWAEIISTPDEVKEALPESQEEFVKANPEMSHVEEFEAGEVVDVFLDHSEKWDCDGWRYLGIKNSTGSFVCEWEKTPEVQLFSKIRKIDPDRELKEMADEVYKKAPQIPTSIGWGVSAEDFKHALIEMGKKVKSKNK